MPFVDDVANDGSDWKGGGWRPVSLKDFLNTGKKQTAARLHGSRDRKSTNTLFPTTLTLKPSDTQIAFTAAVSSFQPHHFQEPRFLSLIKMPRPTTKRKMSKEGSGDETLPAVQRKARSGRYVPFAANCYLPYFVSHCETPYKACRLLKLP